MFFSGNTVAAAEANFIPVIKQQLAAYAAASGGQIPAQQAQVLYTAEVGVDTLNVRAQPTTSAMINKQLSRGVDVSVYEDRDGWSAIDPSKAGWVDNHFLTRTSGTAKVAAQYTARVTVSVLNVRSLPSLSGVVRNTLNIGTSLYVYQQQNGWSRIDPADSLWVNSSYLARTDNVPV
jgi:uncharacterized protein YgiM (DUF1202 family)